MPQQLTPEEKQALLGTPEEQKQRIREAAELGAQDQNDKLNCQPIVNQSSEDCQSEKREEWEKNISELIGEHWPLDRDGLYRFIDVIVPRIGQIARQAKIEAWNEAINTLKDCQRGTTDYFEFCKESITNLKNETNQ